MSEKTLAYRWFGAGKLPDDVRSVLEKDVVTLAEGIHADTRFEGHVTGLHTGGRTFRFSGALAITPSRIIATLGSWTALDLKWGKAGGPVHVTITPDALTAKIEVAALDAQWTGALTVVFHHAFTPDELAKLPSREMHGEMTAEHALQLAGAQPKRHDSPEP